ncbi:MAG TPA: hypothetical protein DDW81_01020 [Cryomorphaceae bacterium]|nr:hypothetical protein [Cryomorphaceae bacterium]
MKYLSIYCLLLMAHCALAEEAKPAGYYTFRQIVATPKPQGDFTSLKLPVFRAGQLLLIEADVDGQKGFFIFDTGAPYLILNETYFRQTGLNKDRIAGDLQGQNEEDYIATRMVHRLQINDLYFENVDADIVSLGHIENKRGIKILGLLGLNLFTSFELELDVVQRQLYLHKLNGRGSCISDSALTRRRTDGVAWDMDWSSGIIKLITACENHKMCFGIDSGAELNILNSEAHDDVLDKFVISRTVNVVGTHGETDEVIKGTMEYVNIGGESFESMNTIVMNLEPMSESYGINLDGMLGYEFLKQRIVCINFTKNTITLYKR